MALERASILEQTRYGVHAAAAPATAVAADRRLRSLELMPTPVEPQDDVTARGFKGPGGSTSQHGKHSTLAVSGRMSFYDTIVACALCLCKPVITTPGAAVKTRRYAFRPSAETADDINVITLLLGAEEAGLELLDRDGNWLAVSARPGELAVNVGDMLQRLTNHVLRSTTHRVANPAPERAGHARYSMPFFLHFRPDYRIATLPQCVTPERPDRYPEPILTNDYLMQRLREIKLA